MPVFSERSLRLLSTADKRLQALFEEVVKTYDCTVLCGHRGKEDQEEAYRGGKSKVLWPFSKHNRLPSLAVDVVPWPIDWEDTRRLYHFAGYVQRVADELGIAVRWGGDFNQDGHLGNDRFVDGPHWEIASDDPQSLAVVEDARI